MWLFKKKKIRLPTECKQVKINIRNCQVSNSAPQPPRFTSPGEWGSQNCEAALPTGRSCANKHIRLIFFKLRCAYWVCTHTRLVLCNLRIYTKDRVSPDLTAQPPRGKFGVYRTVTKMLSVIAICLSSPPLQKEDTVPIFFFFKV